MKVTKAFDFSYGHVLPNHKGKCRNPHGHNCRLEVTVEGDVSNETGMIIDFGDLKLVVKGVVDEYNHAWIFGTEGPQELLELFVKLGWRHVILNARAATAEELCYTLIEQIAIALNDNNYDGLRVSLRLYETPDSWVEV